MFAPLDPYAQFAAILTQHSNPQDLTVEWIKACFQRYTASIHEDKMTMTCSSQVGEER